MNIQIRKCYIDQQKSEILCFLDCNNAPPTHYPFWNQVVSRHYSTSFFYLIAFNKDQIIGILPIHETKRGPLRTWYSGQFNYIPYGGWIWSKGVSNGSIRWNIPRFTSLMSFQYPLTHYVELSGDDYHELPYRSTLILDLDVSLDDIFMKEIDSKRRNMIRKAEKSGVRIEIGQPDDVDSFYELYITASTRNGLSIMSRDFFMELLKGSDGVKFIVLNAYLDKELLANVVLTFNQNIGLYWLGNNSHKHNLGQTELLQWTAIQILKSEGCKYYDLCYIEKERLPQIHEFKKGFAKTEVDIRVISMKSRSFQIWNRISKYLNV